MTETCSNCRFLVVTESGAECHRFPPVYVPDVSGDNRAIKTRFLCIWPDVSQDEWCGEWTPTGEGN